VIEIAIDWYFLNTTYFLIYLNATILPEKEEDMPVIKPGINPDADTNVIIEPSTVCTVKFPTCPTYNPAATNGKEPIGFEPVTFCPPENCPFSTYDA
jgi:hypothetical protein